jgi:hypothetical protein
MDYCPNYLRINRGRETLIIADIYYYFYYTAYFNNDSISNEAFN